jgi:hypothetical protein
LTLHHEYICMLDVQALSASWQTSWHPCPADQTLFVSMQSIAA